MTRPREIGRTKKRRHLSDQRGFTLPELTIVIAVMGILAAIAVPVWWGIVEGRRVDSAANQLASDLRLAHTRAQNQLSDYRVEYTPGSGAYRIVRVGGGSSVDRSLEGGSKISSSELGPGASVITFESDGTVSTTGFSDADSDSEIDVVVSTEGGSPERRISINPATSRVEIA